MGEWDSANVTRWVRNMFPGRCRTPSAPEACPPDVRYSVGGQPFGANRANTKIAVRLAVSSAAIDGKHHKFRAIDVDVGDHGRAMCSGCGEFDFQSAVRVYGDRWALGADLPGRVAVAHCDRMVGDGSCRGGSCKLALCIADLRPP